MPTMKTKEKNIGQAAIEYMLLLGVIVSIALVSFKKYLPALQDSGSYYFNEVSRGILGKPNPCGDGWRDREELENINDCCDNFIDAGQCGDQWPEQVK